MRNITISLSEDLLKSGRNYAQEHHLSLNGLLRQLLARAVLKTTKKEWLAECFDLMDKAKGDSHASKWSREELYRG